jgi:hypothetical protein
MSVEINPGDAVTRPGLVARYTRRDDIVRDLVDVRTKQDRAIADLGLKAPPSVPRLREASDVRSGFQTLFQDLEIEPPTARSDANSTAERLAHLELLQRHCPQWKNTKLASVAAADTSAFETIASDIVTAASAVASDPTIGSFRQPNALRPVVRTDASGHRTTKWCGNPATWMSAFYPPVQTVLRAVSLGFGTWLPGPPP